MKEYDVRNLACPGPVLKLRGLLEEGEREIRFLVADDCAGPTSLVLPSHARSPPRSRVMTTAPSA